MNDSSGPFEDDADSAPNFSVSPDDEPTERPDGASWRFKDPVLIGAGGMGRVSAAFDPDLGRQVALKELKHASPQLRARLAREARITAQLEHPAIVPVYEYGEHQGSPYYAMRLVRGRTLSDAISEAGGLDGRLALVRDYLAVCNALAYAHDRGVVHRDLKPSNVMLGAFGEVQVVDWGLAAHFESPSVGRAAESLEPPDRLNEMAWDESNSQGGLTRVGAIVGTPAYMAPEQLTGLPASPRSDVFGLGCILYQLLTATAPFPRSKDRTAETVPAPITSYGPNIPAELSAVVRRAMSLAPSERYADAASLAEDVDAWLSGRRVGAHEYSPWELARRLYRAWRVPILALAISLLVIAGIVATAARRVVDERDRAQVAETHARAAQAESDGQLANALTRAAVSAASKGLHAEAYVLAARAAEISATPTALGAMAFRSLDDMPVLVNRTAIDGCRELTFSTSGRAAVCVRDEHAARLERLPDGSWKPRCTLQRSVLNARFVGERVLATALQEPRIIWLDDRCSATTLPRPADRSELVYHRNIRGTDTAGLLQSGAGAWIVGDTIESVAACPTYRVGGRHDALALLCHDGRLLWKTPGSPPVELRSGWSSERGRPASVESAHGERVLAWWANGYIEVFDASSPEEAVVAEAGIGALSGVEGRRDGVYALVGERGQIAIFDSRTSRFVSRIPVPEPRDVRWLSNGELLIGGRTLEHWRVPAARPQRLRLPAGAASLSLSTNGLIAAHTGVGTTVHTRETGKQLAWLPSDFVDKAGAFSAGNRVLNIAGLGFRQHRVDDWAPYPRGARSIGGRRLVGTESDVLLLGRFDGNIWVLPADYGSETWQDFEGQEFQIRTAPTRDLETTPDQRWAIHLTADGGLWRHHKGDIQDVGVVSGASAVAIYDEGARVVYAQQTSIVSRHLETGDEHDIGQTVAPTMDVAVSHDERWVATGNRDGRIHVFSAAGGHRLEIVAHAQRTSDVAFELDDMTLWSASWDGTVKRWSLEALHTIPASTAVSGRFGLSVQDSLRRAAELIQ